MKKQLTNTELIIVKLICKQHTSKEMAEKLGYTVRTIEDYRARILKKIKARNTVGIALYAVKHKITSV